MTMQITRAMVDALGFDIDAEIATFAAARAAHAQSEGQPAPRAHPLVEQIVTAGAGYEIIEPPPIPALPLPAYAADVRWRKEVGGILVEGIPVATDDRSKLMITGARVAAMADPGWTTTWHGTDGNSYPVDAAAMVTISDAVQAHVNATFATFATVKAAIEAGEITTAAEVDAAFDEPA